MAEFSGVNTHLGCSTACHMNRDKWRGIIAEYPTWDEDD